MAWDDRPVTVDLFDVLALSQESRSNMETAKLFLEEVAAGGPVAETEVVTQARDEGISPRTLRRAKDVLAVASEKRGVLGGWVWSLPAARRKNVEDDQTLLQHHLDTFVVGQNRARKHP